MKKHGINLFFIMGLVICAFCLGACFSAWKGDEGVFSINVGSAQGRAAEGWYVDDPTIARLRHTITLSGGPGSEQTASVDSSQTVVFSVSPGKWDILVEAFDGAKLYARGIRNVDIKAGPNGVITIPMDAPDDYFTITFILDGGKWTDANNKIYDDKYTCIADRYKPYTQGKAIIPVRGGYQFAGWLEEGTTRKYDFSANVSGPVTLRAQWELLTVVPGNSLGEKLNWLQANAQSDIDYIIEVKAKEEIDPQFLSYNGKKLSITLKGIDAAQSISPKQSAMKSLITIGTGVTLILDNNISIQGRADNESSLVAVDGGAVLIMNEGSKITGNTNNGQGKDGYNDCGGVKLGGSLIMRGGEISNNTAKGKKNDASGGGVELYLKGSSLTMESGTISGNSAAGHGGGVLMWDGSFTMKGGTISGNTAAMLGGGVYASNGTFTKTKDGTGIIYGGNGDSRSNKAGGDTGAGHAVFMSYGVIEKWRDNTAGSGVYLFMDGNASPPKWDGEWELVADIEEPPVKVEIGLKVFWEDKLSGGFDPVEGAEEGDIILHRDYDEGDTLYVSLNDDIVQPDWLDNDTRAITWYILGSPVAEYEGQYCFNINANDYKPGKYTLTVVVLINKIPYSNEITFRVEEIEG